VKEEFEFSPSPRVLAAEINEDVDQKNDQPTAILQPSAAEKKVTVSAPTSRTEIVAKTASNTQSDCQNQANSQLVSNFKAGLGDWNTTGNVSWNAGRLVIGEKRSDSLLLAQNTLSRSLSRQYSYLKLQYQLSTEEPLSANLDQPALMVYLDQHQVYQATYLNGAVQEIQILLPPYSLNPAQISIVAGNSFDSQFETTAEIKSVELFTGDCLPATASQQFIHQDDVSIVTNLLAHKDSELTISLSWRTQGSQPISYFEIQVAKTEAELLSPDWKALSEPTFITMDSWPGTGLRAPQNFGFRESVVLVLPADFNQELPQIFVGVRGIDYDGNSTSTAVTVVAI